MKLDVKVSGLGIRGGLRSVTSVKYCSAGTPMLVEYVKNILRKSAQVRVEGDKLIHVPGSASISLCTYMSDTQSAACSAVVD